VEFDHQMTTLNSFTARLPALVATQLGTMLDVKALVTVSRDWKTSVIVACREDARLREVVEKSCKCNTALTGQSEKDKLVWMRRVQPDHHADELIMPLNMYNQVKNNVSMLQEVYAINKEGGSRIGFSVAVPVLSALHLEAHKFNAVGGGFVLGGDASTVLAPTGTATSALATTTKAVARDAIAAKFGVPLAHAMQKSKTNIVIATERGPRSGAAAGAAVHDAPQLTSVCILAPKGVGCARMNDAFAFEEALDDLERSMHGAPIERGLVCFFNRIDVRDPGEGQTILRRIVDASRSKPIGDNVQVTIIVRTRDHIFSHTRVVINSVVIGGYTSEPAPAASLPVSADASNGAQAAMQLSRERARVRHDDERRAESAPFERVAEERERERELRALLARLDQAEQLLLAAASSSSSSSGSSSSSSSSSSSAASVPASPPMSSPGAWVCSMCGFWNERVTNHCVQCTLRRC
jgi:hypothetical protein